MDDKDMALLEQELVGTAAKMYEGSVGEKEAGKTEQPAEGKQENVEEPKTEENTQTTEQPQQEGGSNEQKPEEQPEGAAIEKTSDEKKIDELLDELLNQGKEVESKKEEVSKQVEQVEKAAEQNNAPEVKKEIEDLKKAIAEKDVELEKYKTLADALKKQYDKLLEENVQLKYGNGTDNGLMEIINNDEDLKNLVSFKLQFQKNPTEENKQKLVDYVKTLYESLTGASLDNLVANKKEEEAGAFVPPEEANSLGGTASSNLNPLTDILT